MSTRATMRNVGAFLGDAALALDSATITAAAGNDNVAVNGNIIDRLASTRDLAMSCILLIHWKAALTADKTLSLTALVQDGADSGLSDAATYGTARGAGAQSQLATTVVATATGTSRGVTQLNLDLSGAKQYMRAVVTADLSHSGTDTVTLGAVFIFGGQNFIPQGV